MNAVKNDTLL